METSANIFRIQIRLYKGISSIKLLVHVAELLRKQGYAVGNIDATVIAQKPKMAPHIPQMRKNMADASWNSGIKVNIKATTEEGLGLPEEERLHSQAICLSYRETGLCCREQFSWVC